MRSLWRGRRNFMHKWQNGRVYFKVKWNETLHTPFSEPLLLTQDRLIYRPQNPATVYTVTSPTPTFFVKSIEEIQCLSHMFSCSSSSFIRPHMEAQRVLCCLSFNHKTQDLKLLSSQCIRTWMTHGHLSNVMLECSGWFLTDILNSLLFKQVALLLLHHPGVVDIRSVGPWAEKQKVLASSPGFRQKCAVSRGRRQDIFRTLPQYPWAILSHFYGSLKVLLEILHSSDNSLVTGQGTLSNGPALASASWPGWGCGSIGWHEATL